MALVSLRFRHNRRLQAAAANSPSMKAAEQDTDAVRILQQALHDVIRPNGSLVPMPLTFRSGGPDGIYETRHSQQLCLSKRSASMRIVAPTTDRLASDSRGVRSALSRRRPGPSGSHYTRRTNTERSAAASAARQAASSRRCDSRLDQSGSAFRRRRTGSCGGACTIPSRWPSSSGSRLELCRPQ